MRARSGSWPLSMAGEADGAGAFDGGFFEFGESQDGEGEGVLRGLGIRRGLKAAVRVGGVSAGLGDGESHQQGCGLVGDGDGVAGGLGGGEAGGVGGLDADYLDVGFEVVHDGGDAGEEAAAADGDEDGLAIGDLFEDFKGDGALTGDDLGIVERGGGR